MTDRCKLRKQTNFFREGESGNFIDVKELLMHGEGQCKHAVLDAAGCTIPTTR